MSVCTKERKGVAAEVLMATPCTNSLGGESEGHKHEIPPTHLHDSNAAVSDQTPL